MKSLKYFCTDKILLESTFHWLFEDAVKFEVDFGVCRHNANTTRLTLEGCYTFWNTVYFIL